MGSLQKNRANRRKENPVNITNRRVQRLKAYFESQGYVVLANEGYFSRGADMIVLTHRKEGLVKILEVTNYAERDSYGTLEYIPDYKLDRYISNLHAIDSLESLGFKVERILVVSYPTNLTAEQMEKLANEGINVWIIGYQD